MADAELVIASHRRAVSAFVDAARAVPPSQWATPRAPGKWSPGQVTEHVALAYEQSGRMLHGTFTGPAKPWYQRLLARWLGLPSLLKRGDSARALSKRQTSFDPARHRPPPLHSWPAWRRPRTTWKRLSPGLPMLGE